VAESEMIFVYNADSGLWNGFLDLVHKNVSPETYACSLCALTYNNLGMRGRWREFVNSLPLPVRFLHRDELEEEFKLVDVQLPAAYLHCGNAVTEWMSAGEFDQQESLDGLIAFVAAKATALPSC